MALAESGRFEEARHMQAQLIADAEENEQAERIRRLRGGLERYRSNRPLRLPGLPD